MNTPTVRACNCRRCTKTEAQASARPTPPAVGDGTTSTGGEGSSLSPAPGAPPRFLVVDIPEETVKMHPDAPKVHRRVIAFELDSGFAEAYRADRKRHPA